MFFHSGAIHLESGGTNWEFIRNHVFKINVKQCEDKNNAPMKKQRERTSTFCVLRQIVPLIPFVFCLCFTHSECSYQALIEIITSFYCICFLCTYLGCFF